LQTLTDVCQFSRREVDSLVLDLGALLLAVSPLLLAVRALAKALSWRAISSTVRVRLAS
jgi:hypothetical protein